MTISDIDTAAAIAGDRGCPLDYWPALLSAARARQLRLREVNPDLPQSQMEDLLRSTTSHSETDFTLLCAAARWFSANEAAAHGLTPRQVPLAGVHAKWLNTHQGQVSALAGCGDGLRLLPNYAPRIHFTYLDPEYRRTGGRLHDSHTLGDTLRLPYRPSVIVISETKTPQSCSPPARSLLKVGVTRARRGCTNLAGSPTAPTSSTVETSTPRASPSSTHTAPNCRSVPSS